MDCLLWKARSKGDANRPRSLPPHQIRHHSEPRKCVNRIAGDRALLPPSSADLVLSKPGWADITSANLTPASGRQDHTTSPYAATSFVSSPFDRSRTSTREARPASRHAPDAAASTA